jgi:hypothetical protein
MHKYPCIGRYKGIRVEVIKTKPAKSNNKKEKRKKDQKGEGGEMYIYFFLPCIETFPQVKQEVSSTDDQEYKHKRMQSAFLAPRKKKPETVYVILVTISPYHSSVYPIKKIEEYNQDNP